MLPAIFPRYLRICEAAWIWIQGLKERPMEALSYATCDVLHEVVC